MKNFIQKIPGRFRFPIIISLIVLVVLPLTDFLLPHYFESLFFFPLRLITLGLVVPATNIRRVFGIHLVNFYNVENKYENGFPLSVGEQIQLFLGPNLNDFLITLIFWVFIGYIVGLLWEKGANKPKWVRQWICAIPFILCFGFIFLGFLFID